MSENNDDNAKTEEPTEKRLQDAFEEGNFASAPEIAVVAVLTAAYITLLTAGKKIALNLEEASIMLFSNLGHWGTNEESVAYGAVQILMLTIKTLAPLAIACFFAAIISGGIQTRFRLTPKVVHLKFSKLDPIAGFKKIFSLSSLIRFAIDLGKFLAISFVLYAFSRNIIGDPIFHFRLPVGYIGDFIFNTSMSLLGKLIIVLSVIAVLSYFYQHKKLMKDLRMTIQELKEEHKHLEMSPQVKTARRQLAKKLLNKQMLEKVPLSDVIVTNPTHYAIALKYERGKDEAPVVLAKGENRFAKRIIAIANQYEVPRVENKPVARLLFKLAKVGEVIPMEFYQVIAEILAYVYRTHRYYFHRLKVRRLEEENNQ